MISFSRILMIIIIIWTFIYTCSYGVWTWKKKNKTGAVMVFFIAAASLLLPVYAVFLRGG